MTNEQMALLYMLYIARKNNNSRHRLAGEQLEKVIPDIYKDHSSYGSAIDLLESKGVIHIDVSVKPINTAYGVMHQFIGIFISDDGYNLVDKDISTFINAYTFFEN